MSFEKDYKKLLNTVLTTGDFRQTRAGYTKSIFGTQLVVKELTRELFPIITGRKMYPKGIIGEMATFLQGPTNIKDFEDNGCNYWSDWGDINGDINVDYGNLWRNFEGVDQIGTVIDSIKKDPNGRRHIITSWHPGHIKDLSLPCCHWAYQFYVNGDRLELIWIQRSVDLMLGLPADIVLGALLLCLMAKEVGLKPGKMVFQMGDTHIYESHFKAAKKYTRSSEYKLPTYSLNKSANLHNFKPMHFKLINYECGPKLELKLETGL